VLDATIVRMVLVPATMALMGRANWWLPGWLDRRLPRVASPPIQRPLPAPQPQRGRGRLDGAVDHGQQLG
jgi:RND superfamily putative drug exporter